MNYLIRLSFFISFLLSGFVFSQNKINTPSYEQAKKDLKKYESKILKQIKQYGYNSLDGFKIELKYPDKEGKGAFKKYSRSSLGCYKTVTQTYSDVWPADWYIYPFLLTSPKNSNGEMYEFNTNVRYSRSSFNKCLGTLKNQYAFHAINVYLNKVSGNELSNDEMRELMFAKIDDWNKLDYYGSTGHKKGITIIDSVNFEKDEKFTHSEKTLSEYFVTLYGELADYKDFMPQEVNKIIIKGKLRLRITPNKPTEVWFDKKDEIIGDAVALQSYPSAQNLEQLGCSSVFQNYKLSEVPACSYKTMMNAVEKIQEKTDKSDKKTLLSDEELNTLFTKKEDLEQMVTYFDEMKNGMWDLGKTEVLDWFDLNNHSSGHITIWQKMERNLNKTQLNELKGKVSKESLKMAKTHQVGRTAVKFYFKDVNGVLKIEKVEFKNQLKVVR